LDWQHVMEVLSRAPYHVDFLVYKDELPDPSSACLEPSWGRPRGQLRDWRVTLPDGSCMHVVEYRRLYVVHRDRANLNDSVVRHVALDEPKLILPLAVWLPFLELLRVLYRVARRRRLLKRGDPCAYNGSDALPQRRARGHDGREGPGPDRQGALREG